MGTVRLKNPSVKLSDVARLAGMSQATASRALRGMKVHKKFQGKAEAAALELGYVLNESARALRNVRTMTVGMIYYELTSLLGMELLGAITAGLDELGYSVMVSTAQGDGERYDRLAHRFLQRRVDALVCVHGHGEGASLQGYAAAGIPVLALITQQGGYANLPRVGPTVAAASAQAIASLQAQGHRSVMLLAPDRLTLPMDGFMAAAEQGQMAYDRVEINEATFDAADFLAKLKRAPAPPTAIVALQAEAVALIGAADAAGLNIPEDISLIAIRDRTVVPAALKVQISTLHLNPKPMGQAAAEVLKAWLQDGVALEGFHPVEIGEWIDRDTIGPAKTLRSVAS